ncbi:MAG TPA: hypothetical protein VJC12_02265 [Candidatus Paceibacterota bacterium]
MRKLVFFLPLLCSCFYITIKERPMVDAYERFVRDLNKRDSDAGRIVFLKKNCDRQCFRQTLAKMVENKEEFTLVQPVKRNGNDFSSGYVNWYVDDGGRAKVFSSCTISFELNKGKSYLSQINSMPVVLCSVN